MINQCVYAKFQVGKNLKIKNKLLSITPHISHKLQTKHHNFWEKKKKKKKNILKMKADD